MRVTAFLGYSRQSSEPLCASDQTKHRHVLCLLHSVTVALNALLANGKGENKFLLLLQLSSNQELWGWESVTATCE